ncbi:hypothetical protein [uncultured Nitrosomonas sp.]|uniref:hypothetical protein n=1 Tax=uncultured Nitrosomonas sp. TaxID=156424 RepID=UPI0025F73098|nr:hypothetical protein [uncultured Nitrosomonas sp.]
MKSTKPLILTIEEAVALMINLDYIPTGFSLLEMTSAFLEEAEVEYENAQIKRFPEAHLESLKFRMDACKARHTLALNLMDQIRHEIQNSKDSKIVSSEDSTSLTRLTFESVFDWAGDKFGIGSPKISSGYPVENHTIKSDNSTENFKWEDVTIKIYKDYNLGYKLGNGKYKKSSFQKIGLMGIRKLEPNYIGGILIILSKGIKFPNTKKAAGKDKTAISKLRSALVKLTDIEGDPFTPFNEVDGWKPSFKLIDDRRNADERAKQKAVHVPLDENKDADNLNPETPDFENINDEAGNWLNEHG